MASYPRLIRKRTLDLARRSLGVEPLEARHLLAAAPLVISEFLASNDNGILDGLGNSADWIEIHNPTAEPIPLNGWFLSDSETQLEKWPFPDVQIAAGAYQVVFASGQATDDFVDPEGNLHTNFKLSKSGEFLGLTYRDAVDGITVVQSYAPTFPEQYEDVSYGVGAAVSQETLVGEDASARLLVPSNGTVDSVWSGVDFDDSNWQLGTNGIGYENSPADYASLIRTTVPSGTDSVYIRYAFDVQNAEALDSLTLQTKYDDGFVAYLNGEPVPVAQQNAPASPTFRSVATGNHPDELAANYVPFDLTSQLGLLRDGPNVLAIHALNQGSSSDMLLLAELSATRPDSTEVITTGYFPTPTPRSANSTGIANPGPLIQNVTENPGTLDNGEALVVTAKVAPLAEAVGAVSLHYRAMFGTEMVLAMVDDGSGSDAVSGDGIFTAVIPGATAAAGEMLRWFVVAEDAAGSASRAPAFLDQSGNGQSPAYFGTVVADPTFQADIPVFRWFTENEAAAHSRSGTRASVYYGDRFYDNLFVRRRGGFTNSSVSQKFDFNADHGLFVNERVGTVSEINLNGNGSDASYLRQSMGFNAHTAAGGAGSFSFHTAMLVNGDFDRVGVAIEQVDQHFLQRQGYESDGDLYKLVQRSNLNPAVSDTTTGLEKKNGAEGLASFAELVSGLQQRTEAQRQAFLRDNVDIAQVVNYMAVRSLQHQADDVRKNMYLYQERQGDGLWRLFPWDLDWTFNVVGGHDNSDSERTEHPFFGTRSRPTADGANQWNQLYDVLFETEELQEMYLRRLRTLMDEFYGGEAGGTDWFTDYVDTYFPSIDPFLRSSVTSAKNSLLNSIQDRRGELYNDYTDNIPGYTVVIPPQQIDRPELEFGEVDFSPASGDQGQEYLEIRNPNSFAVDVSGWTLSGGIEHVFQPGTVLAPQGELIVTADVSAFRERTVGPRGGQGRFVQEWNSGNLSNFSEEVELRHADGAAISSLQYAGQPTANQLSLRISEIYYHPVDALPGEPNVDDQRFEFVELYNSHPEETLDLRGVYFSQGIDFVFPDDMPIPLAPLETVLVVADRAAFSSRYTGPLPVVGEFQSGSALDNAGESLKLEDRNGDTILKFSYGDQAPWPVNADGAGAALVPIDLASGRDASPLFDQADNWQSASPTPGEFNASVDNPGDSDGDGLVSFADFLVLSANFGNVEAVFADGDFDGDGEVGFSDFLILSSNFGRRY